MNCEHTNTQFGECVHCGAVVEHTIVGCPKPQKRVEDPEYMLFVRGLNCCAILLDGPGRCDGENVPHHAGRRRARVIEILSVDGLLVFRCADCGITCSDIGVGGALDLIDDGQAHLVFGLGPAKVYHSTTTGAA